ncbi:MAG: hypothetical protein WCV73_05120 [Patescibacteria group bacterium]|jgi:hypothetical protein
MRNKTKVVLIPLIVVILISVFGFRFKEEINFGFFSLFHPKVKIEPSKILFKNSEWTQKLPFVVYSNFNKHLYDLYLLVDFKALKTEDIYLNFKDFKENNFEKIGDISINYDALILNCTDEVSNDFILLKIKDFNPNSSLNFDIQTKKQTQVDLSVLTYSFDSSGILYNKGAVAATLEIPKELNKKCKLKGVSLLFKNNQNGK